MTDTTAAAASEPYRLVVAHWKEDPRTIHGPEGYLVGGLDPEDGLRLCAELNRLAAQPSAATDDQVREWALIGLYLVKGRSAEKDVGLSIEWDLGDREALLADAEGWALEDARSDYDRIFSERANPKPSGERA